MQVRTTQRLIDKLLGKDIIYLSESQDGRIHPQLEIDDIIHQDGQGYDYRDADGIIIQALRLAIDAGLDSTDRLYATVDAINHRRHSDGTSRSLTDIVKEYAL